MMARPSLPSNSRTIVLLSLRSAAMSKRMAALSKLAARSSPSGKFAAIRRRMSVPSNGLGILFALLETRRHTSRDGHLAAAIQSSGFFLVKLGGVLLQKGSHILPREHDSRRVGDRLP